jgi:GT2 family glycosyltransferase
VIESDRNRGFSGGNNLGTDYLLRNTDATHWLLLNNDATVKEDFFAHIAGVVQATPSAGLITGTIYNDPERDRVWYAGGREIPYRALVEHVREVPCDGRPRATEFVTGCAMVLSSKLHEKIGSLPECYFPGYFEDAEYSRRARDAGFSLIYAPRATAYHKVGATADAAMESASILRVQMRHRVYYARRSFRGSERAIALAYLAITKPAEALVETLKGRPRLGWAVLGGTIEGFMNRV